MHLRCFLVSVLWLSPFVGLNLLSQSPYFQVNTHLGTIIKHRSTITFETGGLSYGTDLNLYWQTRGQKEWQELQKFPRFFLTTRYHSLGDAEVVGKAFALVSGVEFNLARFKKSSIHFGYGFGLAYLTKPFDRISNPSNNAIGSHLNIPLLLKFDYEHRFLDKYLLHFGVRLDHYSNGARRLPNLGLNLPAVYIGSVSYTHLTLPTTPYV